MNIEIIHLYSKLDKIQNISSEHKLLITDILQKFFDENYMIISNKKEDTNIYFIVENIDIEPPNTLLLKSYCTTHKKININPNYKIFLEEINNNIKIYKKINNNDIFPKIKTNHKPKVLSILDLD